MMKVPPLQVDEIVQRAKEREIIQFWEDRASYGNLKYQSAVVVRIVGD